MELVVYNEWQKKGYPMGPSSDACDAGLNRRHGRRCSARVKAQRASYNPSTYLGLNGGSEECFWGEGREKTFLTAFNFDNKVFGSPSGCPQEAEVPKAANTRKNGENVNEQLFVATERNAKLRYEGYKKLSEM